MTESLKCTGRSRITILRDQENPIKKCATMTPNARPQEMAVINTPKDSSASAGGIERANYEVEKQLRATRSRCEKAYG